ncbi:MULTISPECIES: biotin/lipoyl-binding protein [unclassified Bradyrhizobium]|uniref:HlyD family secretion protein n=1 Tax=unclassified Bradyrhizobium TaxID=2631580 RepID=UPI00247A5E3B|nr:MULTISPECIES: biotin/lipoyl-binding protein [unclassified Bradyrhizobium]WGS21672.1 biotin/lipoyl-binding protein [Bradyrhizobium sp. ISRA463]WGS28617.1 biotin/lipoyl-binding protein [Bradyrhizobium sp. ISRA464]
MFEDSVLERGAPGLEGAESPPSAATSREPGVKSHQPEPAARAPAPNEGPAGKAPQPGTAQPQASDKARRDSVLRRRPVVSAIGAVLLAAAIGGGYLYMDYSRHFESTDDAFIAARQSAIAPKLSGYITAVPVTDNEHVAAGQVIARLDDRDYRVALAQAEAQVAAARASIENIDAQLDVQQAQIAANQAQVDQSEAALVFAQQQATRYQHLEQTGYGTVQNSEQYTSQLHQQQSALLSAKATLNLAQRQVESLKAQRKSPGSGTAFSLLPAQNATGNYVKIVQRVPVKIVMDNPPTDLALGPGMSVVPTVRIDSSPSLLERLGRLL